MLLPYEEYVRLTQLSGAEVSTRFARIQARIERLTVGHAGDFKPVGEGVSELRIDCGPGYRVYFKKQGLSSIILLAGGDKRTQTKDIREALRLARNL